MSAFHHTPQNERAQASDLANRKANKPSSSSSSASSKIIAKKKILIAASFSEEDSNDPMDISSISEARLNGQAEISKTSLTAAPVSEDFSLQDSKDPVDFSPIAENLMLENDDDSKSSSLEAESVVTFLTVAKPISSSKKLLDGVPAERNRSVHLRGAMFWCFLLCGVLAVAVAMWLLSSGNQSSFNGSLPT